MRRTKQMVKVSGRHNRTLCRLNPPMKTTGIRGEKKSVKITPQTAHAPSNSSIRTFESQSPQSFLVRNNVSEKLLERSFEPALNFLYEKTDFAI